GFDVRTELGVGEALGQEVEGFQDGQSGADQGNELLVEDEKFFEVELLAAAEQSGGRDRGSRAAGPDRIDEEALLRIPVAQFLFGAGAGDLLMDLPAGIRVFEDEIGHCYCAASTTWTPGGGWNWKSLASSSGFICSPSKVKSRMDLSKP